MNKIIELDKDTIEKIAAGEVIERPESIVKEAIENSIDANSTSIQVEIKSGGKDYIRVTDNGDGISYEDLDLAFKKHCTSKINFFSDIYNLNSRGFRGEALNSIASVSKATLVSKEKSSDKAYQINYNFGEFIDKIISVSNKGTTLIVKSLFDNMPVRKKLLASDKTEENRIRALIERFAIGYPNISFKFYSNSRLLINSSGSGELKTSIFEVYGRDFVKDLIKVENDNITGYISNLNLFTNNNNNQMIFVNDRLIYNEELIRAVESQYFGKIPNNKKPVFFLFIKLDSDKIDINIHPSKKYIKILFDDELTDQLKNIVKDNLIDNQSYIFSNKNELDYEVVHFRDINDDKSNKISNFAFDNDEYYFNNFDKNNENEEILFNNDLYIQNELNIAIPNIVIKENDNNNNNDDIYNIKNIFNENKISNFNIIHGVIFKRFFLLENQPNNLLILVDLVYANARNFFELYTKDIKNNKVIIQNLLEPLIYKFNYSDAEFVNTNIDKLIQAGFDITIINDDTFILRGIPMIISDYFKKDDFIDIINILKKDKTLLIPNIIKKVTMISINSKVFFNNNTAINILETLLKSSNPYTAPNGNAIFNILSKNEFLKRFNYE